MDGRGGAGVGEAGPEFNDAAYAWTKQQAAAVYHPSDLPIHIRDQEDGDHRQSESFHLVAMATV